MPSQEPAPFDIDLLCAKLEVARLEQNARSRRHYQPSGGHSGEVSYADGNHRHSMSMAEVEGRSAIQLREGTKKNYSLDPRKDFHSKQTLAALSGAGKPKVQFTQDYSPMDLKRPYSKQSNYSPRRSVDGYNSSGTQPRNAPNRKSVTIVSDRHFEELEPWPQDSIAQLPSPKDCTKRRSRTFPLQLNKFSSKPRPMSAYGYIDSRQSGSTGDDFPESPMGLVNEYTISYDLADILKDERSDRLARPNTRGQDQFEKPQFVSGLRSRSFLNLQQMFKKDKTEVQTAEVDVLDDIPEYPQYLTRANGHHARQKSLPVNLGQDPTLYSKNDEKAKKRRTFYGLFKRL